MRYEDRSGVSGTGIVAHGVEFADGAVAVRWCGEFPSTSTWESVAAVVAIHGHGGATEVRWVDSTRRRLLQPATEPRAACGWNENDVPDWPTDGFDHTAPSQAFGSATGGESVRASTIPR